VDKKDNIQELFNNRFNDFEADVDSQVWDNIQSELANAGGAPTSGVEKSLFSNATVWVAAVSVSAVMGIGYLMFGSSTDEDVSTSNTELVENKEIVTQEEPKTENSNENEIVGSTTEQGADESEVSDTKAESNLPAQNTSTQKEETTPKTENVNESSIKPNAITVAETKPEKSVEPTRTSEIVEVEAATPNKIEMASQSSVLASPMGGLAPLDVAFSTLAENAVQIKWDFDDGAKSDEVSPNHTYENSGIYFVTMIAKLESGEVVMDKAVVEVKAKTKEIETSNHSEIRVGNVFTPNGDGENDEFVIICKGMQSFSMSVYSVNGQLVFQTENPSEYWNGTDRNGNEVEEGTYYYLINAIGEDQNIYAPKGYISVYR